MSPVTPCKICGGVYHWRWEEAFDKFGFDDGDGQVMTADVAQVLRAAGYEVMSAPWGTHNVTIYSIKHNGLEQIPEGAKAGYDNPRKYLTPSIVRLLDRKLGGAR
jgi:hypothetical protein